jgi:hypothetical protein
MTLGVRCASFIILYRTTCSVLLLSGRIFLPGDIKNSVSQIALGLVVSPFADRKGSAQAEVKGFKPTLDDSPRTGPSRLLKRPQTEIVHASETPPSHPLEVFSILTTSSPGQQSEHI